MSVRQPGVRQMMVGSALLFVVFLAAWQWGPGMLGIPQFIVPSASETWHEFLRMLTHDKLLYHTAITAMQVVVGFALGVLLGIVCGFVLGMSPATEFVLSPYILALQIAPKVAFAPLFIIWFGYTVYPKILVCILIVFFPVMINVLGAVRALDPDIVSLAAPFTANRSPGVLEDRVPRRHAAAVRRPAHRRHPGGDRRAGGRAGRRQCRPRLPARPSARARARRRRCSSPSSCSP